MNVRTASTPTPAAVPDAASATGVAVPQTIPSPPADVPVNWDAMAVSMSGLGTAIAWGAFIAALIALLAGLSWGVVVFFAARQQARKAALDHMDEVGPRLMREWLETNLPRYLRELKEMKSDDSDGDKRPDFDASLLGFYADDRPQGRPDDHQGPLASDAGPRGEDRR